MANVQELISQQEERGSNFEKFVSTIKKAALERRTEEFYKSKLDELRLLWQNFEKAENRIRDDPSLSEDDPYIARNLYRTIGERLEKFSSTMEYIDAEMKKLRSAKSKPVPTLREKSTEVVAGDKIPSRVDGIVRMINARMSALSRHLQGLGTIEAEQLKQFYSIKEDTIKKLWNQITELYDEILQQIEDPSKIGLSQENYDMLEDSVQDNLIKLAVLKDKCSETVTIAPQLGSDIIAHSSLPLPKETTPQFNGDCLKWRQFYELFLEMVDKQSLPSVQKMWYLKTNLSGEAGKLISHLSLTEDNYKTAWMLLQERYNNKRVLVSTLVERILSQPNGTSSTASIKALHDTTKECMLALNNLQIDTTSWDALLIQLITKKLDHALYIRFMQSLANPKEVPTMKELFSFLELQFESMESIGKAAFTHKGSTKTVSSVTSVEDHRSCKLCKNDSHPIYHCKKFLAMTEGERLKWIQQHKLCVNCFKSDHAAKTCFSGNCKICSNKHNALLHLPKKSQPSPKASNQSPPTKIDIAPVNVTAVSSASAEDQKRVILATARVIIKATNGMSGEFRAVLDSGSQVNIVTERLIQKLPLRTADASLSISGVGRIQKKAYHRVNIQMLSSNSEFSTNLEAFVLPIIIPPQPNHDLDIQNWQIPKNIRLADPNFNVQGKIDILLGAEFYFSLMQPGTIKLNGHQPILQNTALGWIVGGLIQQSSTDDTSAALTCAIFSETSLEQAIEKLWKLEEVESTEKVMSPLETLCESHFNQHVKTDQNGRFVVSLPFQESPTALGKSHAMAYNRFMSLERRLLQKEDIRSQYIKFMREYEQLGHMQKIKVCTVSNPKYFIPHHCVLKPDSTTTKLRVVFDASAKTSSGQSLNDLMYTGPIVQSELFSILLRFRLPKFVFTTDIEKMYRQILMHPDDQRYQLIIWREDPSHPVSYYKLNTVTYGTRSAPYLATKCLQKIANENMERYPLGSQMLKDNFYMDDGLGGADSLSTAIQKELITILKQHGFILRKWSSNTPRLLKDIPHSDREVNLDLNESQTIKTLGLYWMPQADQFCVKTNIDHNEIISKRVVTSELTNLFDPLGLLAPIVVKAKIFIQQLWQHTLDWDEALPEKLCATWKTFRRELEGLNNFKIPRHVFCGEIPTNIQLHVFADASERAFGAAIYIRFIGKDGRVVVRLICAKSRVAPLKKQTLPRLELCAAVVAAQLATRVKNDLRTGLILK
ncbi:uncharacterized protein LOC131807010 [Musca domestica]|uniref:Uncharacterized protein LOC131807010 n=1 Tax=Musca domestica TaxID=7370 RepID=A0ABM3VQE3_MUSDO|nr:uncharacterized protein LOC131807010 [Musca domestica]